MIILIDILAWIGAAVVIIGTCIRINVWWCVRQDRQRRIENALSLADTLSSPEGCRKFLREIGVKLK